MINRNQQKPKQSIDDIVNEILDPNHQPPKKTFKEEVKEIIYQDFMIDGWFDSSLILDLRKLYKKHVRTLKNNNSVIKNIIELWKM